jgi:succinyl-CoA synthetase beta subunit
MSIKGLPVLKVLVEEAAQVDREIYVGITVDRAAGCPMYVVSGQGGVDIEEAARTAPDSVAKVPIDPCIGLRPYHVRTLQRASGLEVEQAGSWRGIARGLYGVFQAGDATLAEINPLVLTRSGSLLAVDAKVTIDDNALYRHSDLAQLRDSGGETDRERRARSAGISYIELDGSIGCLVNGAGLAMATMDAVVLAGGAPANFLDIGGGAKADVVAEALGIILSDPGVRAILANVFGGITRCDEVATGIVTGLRATGADVPVVVRLQGTNEMEGRRVLGASGLDIHAADDLLGAAGRAIDLARSRVDG